MYLLPPLGATEAVPTPVDAVQVGVVDVAIGAGECGPQYLIGRCERIKNAHDLWLQFLAELQYMGFKLCALLRSKLVYIVYI
jgi:hypothetical protein